MTSSTYTYPNVFSIFASDDTLYNKVKKTLFEFFYLFVASVTAIAIGIFMKRNKEFYYPVLIGLVFGNFIAFRMLLTQCGR